MINAKPTGEIPCIRLMSKLDICESALISDPRKTYWQKSQHLGEDQIIATLRE